jgi:hypothetical protein
MAYDAAQEELALERARIYGEKGVAQEEARQTGATERELMKTPGAFSYSGIPGKFRSTPNEKGADVQAFGKASLAGKRLGDESSYGGQAPLRPEEIAQSEARVGQGQQDFTKPVQVIRRLTSTYQGPQAGEEFASPGQAAQAFRRDNGAPFVPEGGAKLNLQHQNRLEEIAAQGKSQEAGMAGDLMTRKKNSEAFMNRIQSDPRFYKETPEGLQPVIPGLGQLVLGFKAMGESDPEKAFQAFEARATRHIDETKYVNDQGVAKAVENLTKNGYTLTPGQKAWLATTQTDPEAEKKRKDTILQWVNPTAIPGTQTGAKATTPGGAVIPGASAQPQPGALDPGMIGGPISTITGKPVNQPAPDVGGALNRFLTPDPKTILRLQRENRVQPQPLPGPRTITPEEFSALSKDEGRLKFSER